MLNLKKSTKDPKAFLKHMRETKLSLDISLNSYFGLSSSLRSEDVWGRILIILPRKVLSYSEKTDLNLEKIHKANLCMTNGY